MASPYLLDANVFIEAAQRYYAFDLVPSFWRALVDHATTGELLSIDRVKNEIVRLDDDLAAWAKNEFGKWFASTADDNVVAAYREIIIWSQAQPQFTAAAKQEFASVADGWLVAYAKANGCIVVTHEQYSGEIKRRVLIPNVCRAFSVHTSDPYSMLRSLGVKLS